jgi:hypothetical protein
VAAIEQLLQLVGQPWGAEAAQQHQALIASLVHKAVDQAAALGITDTSLLWQQLMGELDEHVAAVAQLEGPAGAACREVPVLASDNTGTLPAPGAAAHEHHAAAAGATAAAAAQGLLVPAAPLLVAGLEAPPSPPPAAAAASAPDVPPAQDGTGAAAAAGDTPASAGADTGSRAARDTSAQALPAAVPLGAHAGARAVALAAV